MKRPLILSVFMLFVACGGSTKTDSTNTDAAAVAVADMTAVNAAGNDAGKCLLTYQTKMDEALPLVVIKKYYAGDLSKAELEYQKSEKYAQHDTYVYRWPSGKTKTQQIMGRQIDVPVNYEVGMAWIEEIKSKYNPDPVKAFYQMYHTPTPDEIKQTKDYLDSQLDKKLAEKGMTSPAEKKAGKGVAGTIMDRKIEFRKIDGLGDAAAWDIPENRLHVLSGFTKFYVIAHVSDDNAANLALAKKLAAEVLAKCQ